MNIDDWVQAEICEEELILPSLAAPRANWINETRGSDLFALMIRILAKP
jgi:hypothetical protein